jgi:tetratricopeptide (TPR) repeat protein
MNRKICFVAAVVLATSIPVGASAAVKSPMKGRLVKEIVDADDFMSKQKFSEAAELYHDAINKEPKNVSAHTGLGLALGKQFKLEAADDEFNKALTLDPENAVAHVGKAMTNIYKLQSSSATIQKNRDAYLKEAEAQARQAIELDSGLPEAHYFLGQALREQGRLDEAAQSFQQAIGADKTFSDAYAGLGLVRMAQNSPVEASANFKQAISLNTGNSTAHFGLGKMLLQQGQVDDAIREFNTALYQYPNSAPTRLALGEAYMQQGNTIAAVKEFQEAIRIKPENSDAYLHIASIRESRGDIEHALAELRSGLEMTPDNADLHLRVADDSLRLEKLDDAIKEYGNVISSGAPLSSTAAKGITRAFFLKAQRQASNAFVASNDFEQAREVLAKAIQMNPNDMELRLADAKMRALSGEVVDLKAIGEPHTDGERIAYAEALLAQNRFADAHVQMNKLLASANDPRQVLAVGDLALMIKDLPSADAAFKRAEAMPGARDRAKRGQAAVTKARELAQQDITLADDLSRKNALASAVDRYHSAIIANPEATQARIGLAQTLERWAQRQPDRLHESVTQYKAYLTLAPQLPAKEVDRINKKIAVLNTKASKLEQRLAMRPKS